MKQPPFKHHDEDQFWIAWAVGVGLLVVTVFLIAVGLTR